MKIRDEGTVRVNLILQPDIAESIETRLREIEKERTQLIAQLAELKTKTPKSAAPQLGRPTLDSTPESPSDKIALFLKLFQCRESVFPKLWENHKKKTKGYSPVCKNEWAQDICRKPQVKCTVCEHRSFYPLNEKAVDAHLRGQMTIGTYAIREDDTCTFLACDFDEKGWRTDVECYRSMADGMGIQVGVEKSRSGNGAHAWIFFSCPVPARMARTLGTLILARCSEARHTIGLDSYDRFFPSQDFLPKGGFGNLIVLPLQKGPREQGNSLFTSPSGESYANQWEYLTQIRCLSLPELRQVIQDYLPARQQIQSPEDDASEITDENILSKSARVDQIPPATLAGKTLELGYGGQIEIPLEGLPSALITKLKRTASFPNPEFYKLQRMRMPIYPHKRFIFSGELRADSLILPRGVLEKATAVLTKAGATVVIRDERLNKKGLKVEFKGTLTDIQESALAAIKKTDTGILSAPPGTGKTVMACALIAKRRAPTLVLVHRQPLVVQWRDRLIQFLGIDKKDIGVLGGKKKNRTGKIDIAMLQSLTRTESLDEITQDYSQVIVDECHHIPATSFESVMKQFPARYVVGLTATPYRKDKLERILFQQCGPVRHEIKSADGGKLEKKVIFTETGFRLPEDAEPKPAYHVLAHYLTTDPKRNNLIAHDAMEALRACRFLLLISDRKDHLETLNALIEKGLGESSNAHKRPRLFRLNGELSAKARAQVLSDVETARTEGLAVGILATASLIGEGFDLPALDTLILAMPLSFKGRMVQYAGRLHRLAEGKTAVVVHDYVDSSSAMFLKMYRNRIKAYQEMGYQIEEPVGLLGPRSLRAGYQTPLFGKGLA